MNPQKIVLSLFLLAATYLVYVMLVAGSVNSRTDNQHKTHGEWARKSNPYVSVAPIDSSDSVKAKTIFSSKQAMRGSANNKKDDDDNDNDDNIVTPVSDIADNDNDNDDNNYISDDVDINDATNTVVSISDDYNDYDDDDDDDDDSDDIGAGLATLDIQAKAINITANGTKLKKDIEDPIAVTSKKFSKLPVVPTANDDDDDDDVDDKPLDDDYDDDDDRDPHLKDELLADKGVDAQIQHDRKKKNTPQVNNNPANTANVPANNGASTAPATATKSKVSDDGMGSSVDVNMDFKFTHLIKKIEERVMKYYSDDETEKGDAVMGAFEIISLGDNITHLTNKAVENVLKTDAVENELERLLSRETNPFRILDVYQNQTKKGFFNEHPQLENLGIAKNDYYCDMVDSLNLYDPGNWMNHTYYYTDYTGYITRYLREAMEETNPVLSSIAYLRAVNEHKDLITLESLSENVTIFFNNRADFKYIEELGLNHLCWTQSYGNIPGHQSITNKLNFVKNLNKFAQDYNDKSKCLPREFFPQTYLLNDKEQCKSFFKFIESSQYKEKSNAFPVQFLMRSFNGSSASLLTKANQEQLAKTYGNGDKCGTIDTNLGLQEYITKPLLLKGENKFNIRVHVLVASTNPLIVFYHDGFVKVSLSKYNPKSSNYGDHLVNDTVSEGVLNSITNAKEKEEMSQYQYQLFDDFANRLVDQKIIDKKTWLSNDLRPQLKKAVAQVVRVGSDKWLKRAGLFRLFDFDFVMNADKKIYFVEASPNIQLLGDNYKIWEYNQKMLNGMLDIVQTLLRSRLTRIRKFMIKFTNDDLIEKEEYKKEEVQKGFFEVTKDGFSKNFTISSNNTWEPVVNLGRNGTGAYFDLIAEECI